MCKKSIRCPAFCYFIAFTTATEVVKVMRY